MTFAEQLNRYLEELDCTASRLSKMTGIPPYTISKYRSGSRRPEEDGDAVEKLAEALRKIAKEKGAKTLLKTNISDSLKRAVQSETEDFDYGTLIKNLKLLVKGFGITITEIADRTNYNRSTLYSMWRGKSKLRDPDVFIKLLAQYIVNRFGDMNGQMKASKLIGWPESLFITKSEYLEAMISWLAGEFVSNQALSEQELQNIDGFDLNEFQKNKYDPVQLSKMPFRLAKINEYVGMNGLEEGVKDFIKAVSMSRSYKDLILYSDFPMSHMIHETVVPKIWVEGLALALQKGLSVKSIHYMDRPVDEIIAELRAWIPMLMSGQFKPLYVENQHSHFRTFVLASGGGVLRGGCVEGHYDDAYFQLFTAPEAVEREYRAAEQLAAKAEPLMETYTTAERDKLENFLQNDASTPGRRDAILSSPPIYTISEGLLDSILSRNRISSEDAKRLKSHIKKEKKRVAKIGAENEIYVRLTYFMKYEFEAYPVRLSLNRSLQGIEILYTFEEYEQHINETRDFASTRKNYHFFVENNDGFRNIQITTLGNNAAMISKNKLPEIHYVLKHPRWVEAIARIDDGSARV